MVDLTKSQIVDPAVECWYEFYNGWKKFNLIIIDHRLKDPYVCIYEGEIQYIRDITLKDPYAIKEPVKRPMTFLEFVKFTEENPNIYIKYVDSETNVLHKPSYSNFNFIKETWNNVKIEKLCYRTLEDETLRKFEIEVKK